MKAAFFRCQGGPEVLEYADMPDPRPGPGEVLIRVHAAALNRLDVRARLDRPEVAPWPHVGGMDVGGEVAELGADVSGWEAGDRVCAHPILSCSACEYCRADDPALCASQRVLGFQTQGGFAEYTVVPAANLIALPPNAELQVLAAVPTAYATAWRMLVTRACVEPGEWVLVHSAAGGVGTAAVQIARFLGARVIGTVGSAAKLEVVRQIGANHALNYHTEDTAAIVADLTRGQGAHVVVDTVGSDTWQTSLACVGKNGHVVTCGVTSGAVAQTNIRHLYQKQVSVMGSVLGGRAELRTVLDLTTLGTLTPHIHEVLPLSAIRRGHEAVESREVVGKIVLDVIGSDSPTRS